MSAISGKTVSGKKTKGTKTRENILSKSRKVFNESGIFLTLSELSKLIGMTIGGITNHFPTKDHLFVGLSEQYENEINELTIKHQFGLDLDFHILSDFFSTVMDIQYKHRSVMLFFSVMHQSQTVMMGQLVKTWVNRQARLDNLVKTLVTLGLLKESILEPKEFAVFRFQYVNLFTTWLVSYSLYDAENSYESMKPVYLKGVFRTFEKYLTDKGKHEFEALQLI